MENTINVPKLLHEVHGEKAQLRDILLAHGLAIVSTATLIILGSEGMALWQKLLLGILTYDLVGGVVANFSYSTSIYYASSSKKRRGFLLLHLLQPTLLTLVFQTNWMEIIVLSAYILIASVIVNNIKSGSRQVITGGFLAVTGIFLLQLPIFELEATLQFLLTVFLLKLPLAWAVRWYDIYGMQQR
ncbi:MAG: hypothetical protein AAF798_05180 [Bacteroidota bacterium]